jgi:hypothetical protein
MVNFNFFIKKLLSKFKKKKKIYSKEDFIDLDRKKTLEKAKYAFKNGKFEEDFGKKIKIYQNDLIFKENLLKKI